MKTSTLTVSIPKALKAKAKRRSKKEGVTLTFVVNQLLQAYIDFEIDFALINEKSEIKRPKVWLANDYLNFLKKEKKPKKDNNKTDELEHILAQNKKFYSAEDKKHINEIDKICYLNDDSI